IPKAILNEISREMIVIELQRENDSHLLPQFLCVGAFEKTCCIRATIIPYDSCYWKGARAMWTPAEIEARAFWWPVQASEFLIRMSLGASKPATYGRLSPAGLWMLIIVKVAVDCNRGRSRFRSGRADRAISSCASADQSRRALWLVLNRPEQPVGSHW